MRCLNLVSITLVVLDIMLSIEPVSVAAFVPRPEPQLGLARLRLQVVAMPDSQAGLAGPSRFRGLSSARIARY